MVSPVMVLRTSMISQTSIQAVVPAVVKISEFAIKNFEILSNSCLVVMGVKELISDHIPWDHNLEKKTRQVVAHPEISNIQKIINQYTLVHGLLFYGSGVFGAFSCLNGFVDFIPSILSQGAKYTGYGLFFLVNLYSIEKNIRIFYHAHKMEASTNDSSVKTIALRLKISAALGILNNLGYVIATVFSLFTGIQAIAIAMAIFALFSGSLKIIIDFFAITPHILPKSD